MMFFANSRSRFKSKPPQNLICCLKFACLAIFFILLVAQLRAIELPAGGAQDRASDWKAAPNGQSVANEVANSPAEATTIDRHDRGSAVADGTNDGKSVHDLLPDSSAPIGQSVINATIAESNQIETQLASEKSSVASSTASPSGLDGGELDALVPLATAQAAQTADKEEPATDAISVAASAESHSSKQVESIPSLAEMTAAGTAAGMLISDLLAKANNEDGSALGGGRREPLDSGSELGGQTNDGDRDGAELQAQMQQMEASDQQQPGQADSGPSSASDDDQLEGGQEIASLEPTADQLISRNEQLRLARAEALQAAPSISDSDDQPEPSSEDNSPDSIEGLMGADGADLGASGDGADGGNALERADSNRIGNDQASLQQMLAARTRANPAGGDDDDDEGDEGEPDATRYGAQAIDAQGSQLRAKHIAGVPVVMSTRYGPPAERHHSELEHNLVAPMRESLVDLNAAAGHYYGKKKKKVKKVKKKVIIKKKKKKKYKYKKVKVVKIKKKKKKKKKKKPVKHHYHHPDHGKYYMYAKVPKKKAWEFGFKKGNKKHWIERHEKGYKNKFKTKVKWYDKKSKGKGVHIWDYNHHDEKKKHH